MPCHERCVIPAKAGIQQHALPILRQAQDEVELASPTAWRAQHAPYLPTSKIRSSRMAGGQARAAAPSTSLTLELIWSSE